MKIPRCQAVIYKRDTYRYSGRGRGGFEMHYSKEQCSHAATFGEWCGKHKDGSFMKCSFADKFKGDNQDDE